MVVQSRCPASCRRAPGAEHAEPKPSSSRRGLRDWHEWTPCSATCGGSDNTKLERPKPRPRAGPWLTFACSYPRHRRGLSFAQVRVDTPACGG